MGLYEKQSLLRSEGQINPAGDDEQNKNVMGGNNYRSTLEYFFLKETPSFSWGRRRRSH